VGSEVDSPPNLTTAPIVYQTLVVEVLNVAIPRVALFYSLSWSFESVNLELSAIVENEAAGNSQCPN
jgi:hypothetical protein